MKKLLGLFVVLLVASCSSSKEVEEINASAQDIYPMYIEGVFNGTSYQVEPKFDFAGHRRGSRTFFDAEGAVIQEIDHYYDYFILPDSTCIEFNLADPYATGKVEWQFDEPIGNRDYSWVVLSTPQSYNNWQPEELDWEITKITDVESIQGPMFYVEGTLSGTFAHFQDTTHKYTVNDLTFHFLFVRSH